jgi:tetratricopeptide (TPR) repeat protein
LARAEAADGIGDGEAAAEAWAAVAAHKRTDPDAWINLARSYFGLKRFGEAEGAAQRALEVAPYSPAAFLTLGLIFERTNRLAELNRLLDRSRRHDISKRQLAYLWAVREQRAGNVAAAREFLLQSDPAEDPVRWYWLRAKLADKEGDPATAFDAMTRMNRATRDFDLWRQRGATFRQELRALAAVMTPEWAGAIPRSPPAPGPRPVFLLGLPRSGTTLLDTFLMGHPAIEVIEEKEMLRRAGQLAGPISTLPHSSSLAIEQARRAYVDELGGYVSAGFGGTVIDKNPFNLFLAPLIDVLFRDAPVIFARRHPCDAVLSGFMQSYIPNIGMASFLDLADGADLYDAVMRVWALSTELFPLNVHSVAYEDLVEDPERELRAVLDFLGLEWDDQVMDHRTTADARGALTNTSYDQITEPLTRGAVGRWRHYESQLEPLLPMLLPWADWLGYRD